MVADFLNMLSQEVGAKAALTRKRKAAGRKAAETRKRNAATKQPSLSAEQA